MTLISQIHTTEFKDGIKPTGIYNIFKHKNSNNLKGVLILRFSFFL